MSNLKYYNDSTGQWEYLVIGKQGPTGPTGATGATGSDGALSPNYIINGAFDIWQRGDSVTVTSGETYTADRFGLQNFNGTVTKQSFSPADIEAVGFGDAEYFARVDASTGVVFSRIFQRLENVRTFAGQTVTFSFWAKADSTREFNIAYRQRFGTGGSSNNTQTVTFFDIGTTWQRYEFTANIDSVSGKTIGDGSTFQIEIRHNPDVLFTLDTWGWQLEAGSVATPFKRHAPSLALEKKACKYYYQRIDGRGNTASVPFVNGNIHAETEFRGILTFEDMRIAPSISADAVGTYDCIAGGAGVGVSSFAFGTIGTNTARVIANLSGSKTVGHGGYITANADGDSAFILDAEL